uniref:PPPDE domain-containing protein n=1 Tax=Acrobeloides nanus TaxID=290746 RepID=A0A914DYD5_9BILA
MARTPVRLNVYDMYWINDYASTLGFGVYHSGIEVYGVEYAYGGHPFSFSGIFENRPQDAEELGENFKFRESILIGETDFSASEVRKMVDLLGQDYRGDRYHLITKNCNHFTTSLAKTLTGQDIPGWINRLATVSGSIPFFERWIPQEWLTPVALQQALDERAPRAASSSNGTATLNYPLLVDDAHEAFEESMHSPRKNTANNKVPSSSRSGWNPFRRGSESASSSNSTRSAPNSARPSSPTLARLWQSIRGLTTEDSSSSLNSQANGTPNGKAQTARLEHNSR